MNIRVRWLSVLLILLVTSGCVEEEFTVTVNSDGTGTLKAHLKGDDRVLAVAAESAAGQSALGGFELYAKPTREFLQTQLPDGMSVLSFEANGTPRESVEITYEIGWQDPALFQSKYLKEKVGLQIRVNTDGQGEVWVRPLEMTQDHGVLSLATPARVYASAKGLRRKLVLRMPVPLTTDTAQMSADGREASWEFNLKDLAGLDAAAALLGRFSKDSVEARFDAAEFSEPVRIALSRIVALPEPPAAPPEGCFCELQMRSFSLIPPNTRMSDSQPRLDFSYALDCRPDVNRMRIEPVREERVKLVDLIDRDGNSVLNRFELRESPENTASPLSLKLLEGSTLPEIGKVVATTRVVMPGEPITFKCYVKDLKASVGSSPLPELIKSGIVVAEVTDQKLTFKRHPQEGTDRKLIQKVQVISGGEEVNGMGHFWGNSEETWRFNELTDYASVTIYIATEGQTCDVVSEFDFPNL